jgi:hypothetical protein
VPVGAAEAGLRAAGEEGAAVGLARPDHDHAKREPADHIAPKPDQQSPKNGRYDVGVCDKRGGGGDM